ncbi:MAG: FAD-binding protein [Cyclobacteriaceae bacterium]|nr:FAD-binding protein [Cyclobacteriaceae bacterium]
MQVREIVLTPSEAFDEHLFNEILYRKLGVSSVDYQVIPVKRSIDARGKRVVVRLRAEILSRNEQRPIISYKKPENQVAAAQPIIIVGSGPAGLFAALRVIESGFKPIMLERGSPVQLRRRDLAAINKHHIVNPDSNYCFGEGGAGTYSDGKLYTRSTKRGYVQRILEILVVHGARNDILFDAHPHIGTNKLPKLVESLRQTILACGGEIFFNTRVDDLLIRNGAIAGVVTDKKDKMEARAVILATGHSARDVFTLLQNKGIGITCKPFALGVRVEHPQQLIDSIQYHCAGPRERWLPASSYSLVHQFKTHKKRGVFSFCMCPGGFIVPAATHPGEVVVNGMSPSRRDSRYANSGIVVSVDEQDFGAYAHFGPLAGMHFQSDIEQRACAAAGGTQAAPALRLTDFLNNRLSASLPDSSYQPGLAVADFRSFFPRFMIDALQEGFKAFGRKMRGYITEEAVVVGVESRTSSPVRIPRNADTLQHPQVKGLFPCGEGAGYAGGIVSAAMDGERCADAAVKFLTSGR